MYLGVPLNAPIEAGSATEWILGMWFPETSLPIHTRRTQPTRFGLWLLKVWKAGRTSTSTSRRRGKPNL
jgi:hypothetical protein